MGTPLMTNKLTKSMEHISYAPVLLDVDVSKPLVQTVSIIEARGIPFDQEVCFEHEPDYYSSCHTISHATTHCKLTSAQGTATGLANPEQSVAPVPATPAQAPALVLANLAQVTV